MRSPGSGWQQRARLKCWSGGQPDHRAAGVDGVGVVVAEVRVDRAHHLVGGQLGAAQPRQHLVAILQPQVPRRGFQHLVGGLLADVLEGRARQFPPQPDEPAAVDLAQGAADRRLGLAGGGDVQPGGLRLLALGGDDLDRLAVLQPRPQRHPHAVNLGADAGMADAGVDGIAEIDRRRPARQLDHVALGGEAEHLVGIHLQLDRLEEILVILLGAHLLGQRRQPARGIDGKGVLAAHAVAVGPVRGDAGPSATSCILWVRICTSTRLPSRPDTVVWMER